LRGEPYFLKKNKKMFVRQEANLLWFTVTGTWGSWEPNENVRENIVFSVRDYGDVATKP